MRLGEKKKVPAYVRVGCLVVLLAITILGVLATRDEYRPTESVWDGSVWRNRGLKICFTLPEGWWESVEEETSISDHSEFLLFVRDAEGKRAVTIGTGRLERRTTADKELDDMVEYYKVPNTQVERSEGKQIAGQWYECVHVVDLQRQIEQYFYQRIDGSYSITITVNGPVGEDLISMLDYFSIDTP